MKANRSDSALERALRSELHRRGLRFRKHFAPLPGVRCKPDIVFPKARVAVFVHGCFWHQCPEHATQPRANGAWWAAKLEANTIRDRRNEDALRAAGWSVVRLWEHMPLEEMVEEVLATVGRGSDLPR